MQTAVSDSYDSVSVFSIYWKSDDTGGREASSLFIDTLSKLQNVNSCQRGLDDDVRSHTLVDEIAGTLASQSGRHKLFILHAIAGSTPDSLIVTPKMGQELDGGPEMDISLIKTLLKDMASKSLGSIDVLLVIDSCCADIAGRGWEAEGGRVELVAATAHKGISNSRKDGRTFTQHWCGAFTKLLEMGKPFTCDDIVKDITPDCELELLPATSVLREGWNLPITFRPRSGPIASNLPAAVTSGTTVVTALHTEENSDSAALNELIKYLDKAPVKITVLSVLPDA